MTHRWGSAACVFPAARSSAWPLHARFLRRSPIIILDEATASVDVETEREIQRAIHRLTGTRTILAIAHRLSTIRDADLILLLKDGEIAERGTHEELLALHGEYYRMQAVQGAGGEGGAA